MLEWPYSYKNFIKIKFDQKPKKFLILFISSKNGSIPLSMGSISFCPKWKIKMNLRLDRSPYRLDWSVLENHSFLKIKKPFIFAHLSHPSSWPPTNTANPSLDLLYFTQNLTQIFHLFTIFTIIFHKSLTKIDFLCSPPNHTTYILGFSL